jgi:DNA-directed RNA polymerase subunit beta
MEGMKVTRDLIDATGEVLSKPARRSPRAGQAAGRKGVKALRVDAEDLIGQYLAEDVVNMETGEIYAEAGDESTEDMMEESCSSLGQVASRCSTSTTSTPAPTSATR